MELLTIEKTFYRRHGANLQIAAVGLFWLTATLLPYFSEQSSFVAGFFLLSIGVGLSLTASSTWRSLKALHFDMHVLMSLAVAGAIFLGDYSEGAMVVFLFALSNRLEEYSVSRAHRAIESLLTLAPDRVTWLRNGEERIVAPSLVPVGETFLVKPGERIGLDGNVFTGNSAVNQAPITGESVPVEKSIGDPVYAGSINGDGALHVVTSRRADDSTLAKIAGLVHEAQFQKAPVHRFVDSFAKIYTPLILAVAILLTAVPTLLFRQPFEPWFYRSLVTLLIGCPCALVLSTPVTILAGLAVAARHGLLIKGGITLEKAARIRVVAFDKTGTLTHGAPQVMQVVALDGVGPLEVLRLAAAVEKHSGHVLAAAIVEHAQRQGLETAPASAVTALPGLGASGIVNECEVFVGNHRLFHDRRLCTEVLHQSILQMEKTANSLVLVGTHQAALGIIALADPLRENTSRHLAALKKAGAVHLCMLTGDRAVVAAQVGAQLPLDEVRAELLPSQKMEAVRQLRERYGPIAMVGDGVNDAPAIAAADLGIAMGAGADQSLVTADVAILTNNLGKLAVLLRLAKTTLARIHGNVALALGIKFGVLVLAALGYATLWMAVLADSGAALLVVGNGLRLLWFRED